MKESELLVPLDSKFNIQGTKHYVFNQTGNIMMSSTDPDGNDIPESVRETFSEVSVFFAAMTKSISQTINPNLIKKVKVGGKEIEQPMYYSLYDYDALEAIIDGSGYFVRVTEQDLVSKTSTYGTTFSTDLLSGVIGLAVGDAIIPFAQSMLASIGKKSEDYVNFSIANSSSSSKVANIIFVCEYIMGMPLISAIVLSVDSSIANSTYQAGPCFKAESTKTELKIHKDTYMFVTPSFIKEFAEELNTEMNNRDYIQLINHLKALVGRSPFFNSFDTKVSGEIREGENGFIIGEYFGLKEVKLTIIGTDKVSFGEGGDKVMPSENSISFSVSGTEEASFSIKIEGTCTSTGNSYTLTTTSLQFKV
ncbi:hypothetical protein ORI89_06630 [Sphingobacterium sp. UT-1RO-CII-1]|uniref:hypothetical protein n=1 Tax=Sphingobacterium sp. UT-1RO-CII-1 TaxID=2995225 RepID=UPI00227A3344|nr:hypothetical protein [Sphingobacterium sp. UT-1RO-CII-1]MCY4779318.1 hypothetical protein [Sphingobacterium sp. UT-1RO-CII-1]